MHAMSAYYSSRAKVWLGGTRSGEPRFVRMGRRRRRTKEQIFVRWRFFAHFADCSPVSESSKTAGAVDLFATWANVRIDRPRHQSLAVVPASRHSTPRRSHPGTSRALAHAEVVFASSIVLAPAAARPPRARAPSASMASLSAVSAAPVVALRASRGKTAKSRGMSAVRASVQEPVRAISSRIPSDDPRQRQTSARALSRAPSSRSSSPIASRPERFGIRPAHHPLLPRAGLQVRGFHPPPSPQRSLPAQRRHGPVRVQDGGCDPRG